MAGLLTSFVGGQGKGQVADAIAAAAIGSLPYDETIAVTAVNTASVLANANDAVLIELPRRMDDILIAKVRLWIAVTGGNLDVGVWSFDGTTYTLLVSSGSTAVGSGNTVQSVPLSASYTRPAKTRTCLGFAADGTTASFGRTSGLVSVLLAAADGRCVRKANSFPLATNAAEFDTGDVAGSLLAYWLRGVSA